VGPTRQSHGPNRGAWAAPSVFGQRWPLPCLCPRLHPLFPPPSATDSCSFKRSTPPKSSPFLLLPLMPRPCSPCRSPLPPLHPTPVRSRRCSFLLERDRPQATGPSVTEEKAVVQSPIHRAPSRGPAALTIPRGRLHHHDLRRNSLPLHDLQAGTLHHSSGLPPVVPSRPTRATVEHPSPVRFSSLRPLNRIPCEPDVVLDRIPRLPVPSVHRIPAGTAAVRHDPSTLPCVISGRKAEMGRASPIRMG
jgi:hypothetical protein